MSRSNNRSDRSSSGSSSGTKTTASKTTSSKASSSPKSSAPSRNTTTAQPRSVTVARDPVRVASGSRYSYADGSKFQDGTPAALWSGSKSGGPMQGDSKSLRPPASATRPPTTPTKPPAPPAKPPTPVTHRPNHIMGLSLQPAKFRAATRVENTHTTKDSSRTKSPQKSTTKESSVKPRENVCKARPDDNTPSRGGGGGGPRRDFIPWCR